MKKGFILLILFLCITVKGFAIRREDICDIALTNLYGYSNNICHLEEKDISNFQALERNVRILSESDIEDFKYDATHSSAPRKAKIKAASLSDALKKYIKLHEQCCVCKAANECDGIELKKMYIRELKKIVLTFNVNKFIINEK